MSDQPRDELGRFAAEGAARSIVREMGGTVQGADVRDAGRWMSRPGEQDDDHPNWSDESFKKASAIAARHSGKDFDLKVQVNEKRWISVIPVAKIQSAKAAAKVVQAKTVVSPAEPRRKTVEEDADFQSRELKKMGVRNTSKIKGLSAAAAKAILLHGA